MKPGEPNARRVRLPRIHVDPMPPAEQIIKPKMTRAARRLKQREENVPRAQKMHEERLQVEPSFMRELTNSPAKKSAKPEYHIGCSGWYYRDWKGIFYPPDLPSHKWFAHYMENFDTVELNAPFYSWPTINTVKTWERQARQRPFIYTIKVCELITHIKRFSGTKTLIKDFGLIADMLGPHMGCFLFQLPPSFDYTTARLNSIVGQLDPARRNVVEFRHASWWNEKVFSKFREANIIFCSCSAPKLPDQLVKTSDDIYIRFHGPQKWYRHDYSLDEIKEWASRIRASRAKRIWVYFNNDYNGYAIKNAHQLIDCLKLRAHSPHAKNSMV